MSTEMSDAVERTVQLAGNSTFVVSLPKTWALEQGIERGASIRLYPHDDRLVLAPEALEPAARSTRIDAESADASLVLSRVRDAYAAGCGRIAVVDAAAIDPPLRRDLSTLVAELIGLEIHRESETELVATDLLDAADVSLAQTVSQIRHRTNSAYDAAIEALVADDAAFTTRALDLSDDVDRLVAFVCRGFRRGLADVTELDRLGADRTAAFTHYRTARSLSRLVDEVKRIATAAARQSSPPEPPIREAFEPADEAVRAVLDPALAGRPEPVLDRYARATTEVAALSEVARASDAVRYELVADSLHRIAAAARSASEAIDAADGDCC
ncbi:phosphate uptake regulator [Halovivax ruber XH-70]|uniref:Phosphate uptake regulator n=1 Tax=Halovivax ruber (strain DSM 18193 / JCM 13892 / XH-70) TaxID=797302 RepID=L0IBL0_HALRX|nr:AbrB/MazE/SpoVT family DNA-binding domain-containing protein [Halovivax ruber]AGB15312.1 phosphate uptake regulator [Halovivax ruber XH-70]